MSSVHSIIICVLFNHSLNMHYNMLYTIMFKIKGNTKYFFFGMSINFDPGLLNKIE